MAVDQQPSPPPLILKNNPSIGYPTTLPYFKDHDVFLCHHRPSSAKAQCHRKSGWVFLAELQTRSTSEKQTTRQQTSGQGLKPKG